MRGPFLFGGFFKQLGQAIRPEKGDNNQYSIGSTKCSKNRTMWFMALSKSPGSVISWLGSQPAIRIIRGLLLSPKPRHLRDLASQYELSPAGASDILRRLKKAGILKEQREGNRRCFYLNLSEEELAHLTSLFQVFERRLIEERAIKISRHAIDRLTWMDKAYKFYRGIKKLRHDPT